MAGKRPTVADVRANKGKYQFTMMRTETWDGFLRWPTQEFFVNAPKAEMDTFKKMLSGK